MTTTTSNQGLTIQQGTDSANEPGAQVSLLAGAENRLVQRYLSIADRTARNGAPNEGEISHLADVDRTEVFDGVNWVSLSRRANWFLGMRTTDAAAINNSTTLVSDAVMTVALPAAGTFMLDGTLYYDSSTVADVKVAIAWPGGASGKSMYTGADPSTTTNFKVGVTTSSASSFSFGGFGVGTIAALKFEGFVVASGAGNLVVQYAQNTLDATNTTIRSGSFLRVIRIS